MNALRPFAPLALVALTALLSACDDTRFATDLAETTPTCDADLSGTWLIVDEDDVLGDYLRVDDSCAMTLLTQKNVEDEEESHLATVAIHPNLVRVKRDLILTISDADASRVDRMDEPDKNEPPLDPPGFRYYRVEGKGDRLRILGVDHRAIAHAIIDAKIEGDTRKKDRNLTNFVTGDREAMRALAAERWLFLRERPLELRRVDPATLPERLQHALQGPSTP